MNNNPLTDEWDETTLPVDRHSFQSTTHSPRPQGSESTVSERESEPPTDTELPESIEDIADPLATAAPSLSQFTLHINPRQTRHMQYFQTFALAEEMMHGRRHRFGLSRSSHLFKLRAVDALYKFVDGDWSPERAGRTIGHNDLYARQIYVRREPFLETVDKFLCQSVMSEAGYLEPHIDGIIETFPDSDREIVEQRFDQMRRLFEEIARERKPDIYRQLSEIEETYNRRAAEAVADAALDVPFLIEPLNQRGFESISLDQLDLEARFEAAANAFRADPPSDPAEVDPEQLRRDIEANMARPVSMSNSTNHPRELDLPLLDVPQSIDTDQSVRNKYDAIMEAPTELGRVLNAAFRFTGNFGGAVYKYPDGEGGVKLNWYVNPLIAKEDISGRLNRVCGAETYAELWEWMYIGNYLIQQLVLLRSEEELPELMCPLCFVAPNGACAGETCAVESVINRVNSDKEALVQHIRQSRSEFTS